MMVWLQAARIAKSFPMQSETRNHFIGKFPWSSSVKGLKAVLVQVVSCFVFDIPKNYAVHAWHDAWHDAWYDAWHDAWQYTIHV